MIQDATGKFSSRCVLPDRSSLALVIEKWLLRWKHWSKTPAALPRRRTDREPHIGEYDPKTNAIGGSSQPPAGLNASPRGPARRLPDSAWSLLRTVLLEHLVTSHAQFGTMLLKAGQNGEIALIDHRTAVALDIASTGRLLLRGAAALRLRLGLADCTGTNAYRQQDDCHGKFEHHVPSFLLQRIPVPHDAGMTRTGDWDCDAAAMATKQHKRW